jgi:hypothetical protein
MHGTTCAKRLLTLLSSARFAGVCRALLFGSIWVELFAIVKALVQWPA